LLDLKKSEEELLQNIKKKDRYLINRAKKEWVEIVKWNTSEQIEILIKMHLEHSKKVGYHAFSRKFIENLYKVFWNNITTISARYNWNVESILMTISFWKTCVYYIAASDIKSHKFSPNYLCQWEAILDAKEKWCETYNFWGVSPDNNPSHPIAWVTKFKRKFGWYDYSLLHAQDLVISPKYWFNYLVETVRRKKRWYYYKKPE
jgi:lipid II:glycine glycyltransferase (peptidoglycan interpeptide bridge formation enzyme)